jgi:hypothetical protein
MHYIKIIAHRKMSFIPYERSYQQAEKFSTVLSRSLFLLVVLWLEFKVLLYVLGKCSTT